MPHFNDISNRDHRTPKANTERQLIASPTIRINRRLIRSAAIPIPYGRADKDGQHRHRVNCGDHKGGIG